MLESIALTSTTVTASDRAQREHENAVALEHLQLAESLAWRYAAGREIDDLRQVAYLGLIKACRRFDSAKGESFVSFAAPTIAGEIKRYLRDHGWVVRPPRSLHDLRGRVAAASADLAQFSGRTPSAAEIAAHLNESVRDVDEALASGEMLRPASLSSPVGDDGATLADLVESSDADGERAEAHLEVSRLLAVLTPRERRILYLRFWRDLTQQEIALELGVTQMQISRLLSGILGNLRGQLRAPAPAA